MNPSDLQFVLQHRNRVNTYGTQVTFGSGTEGHADRLRYRRLNKVYLSWIAGQPTAVLKALKQPVTKVKKVNPPKALLHYTTGYAMRNVPRRGR